MLKAVFIALGLGILSSTWTAAATFEEAWQDFRTAARNGNWVLAQSLMESLEVEFNTDPLYQAAVFQKAYLPFRILVLMQQGEFESTRYSIQRFIQIAGITPRQLAWARFTKARVAQAMGQFDEALSLYENFIGNHPELSESKLALWMVADIHIQQGNTSAAIDSLGRLVSDENAPKHLRQQAKLRRLQIALQSEDIETCLLHLKDLALQESSFPERLIANSTALQLQQFLRENNEHMASIEVSFFVHSYSHIIREFEVYLEQLQKNWAQQRVYWNRRAPIWAQHLALRIDAAEQSIEEFRNTVPYTDAWLLGRGLSFLESGHPWLAKRLFGHLLSQPSDPGLIPESDLLYLTILCFQEIKNWSGANEAIDRFYSNFSEDSRLPSVRFAQARGEFLQGNSESARNQLTHLISDFPEHSDKISWKWLRAQVLTDLALYDQAFDDYRAIHRHHAENRLMPYILLTAAETAYRIQYDLESDEFLHLLDGSIGNNHHLTPYAIWIRIQLAFRRADDSEFRSLREHFFSEWTDHALEPDLLNLSGDHSLRLGEWQDALNWYRKVSVMDALAHEYAIFQKVSIFRNLEMAEPAWALLTNYIAEAKSGGTINRLQDAVVTLNRLAGLLNCQAEWDKRLQAIIRTLGNQSRVDDFSPYLEIWRNSQSPEFRLLMQDLKEEAVLKKEFTLWSRLELFRHPYASYEENNASEAMLLQLHANIPIDYLDAQGLYRIGKLLGQQGFTEGGRYLESLISRYPSSNWTPKAIKALASMEGIENWKARRLWLSLINEWPATEESLWAHLEIARLEANDLALADAVDRLGKLLENRQAPAALRAQAWFERAGYLVELGLTGEAIHHFKRLYSLFPQFIELCAQAYLRSADLLSQNGYPALAVEVLREGLDSIPSDHFFHLHLKESKGRLNEQPEEIATN